MVVLASVAEAMRAGLPAVCRQLPTCSCPFQPCFLQVCPKTHHCPRHVAAVLAAALERGMCIKSMSQLLHVVAKAMMQQVV
jgi:hypothetical protein